jgi:hypothetical protein
VGRALLIPALALALAACAAPGARSGTLDAVGVGIASRLDGDGARTGMTFAYWSAGHRGWGSFAKLRVDAITGVDFLFDDPDDDDEWVRDDPYVDEHVGAIVFDLGLVYRFAENFAAYGGVGLGNLYDYRSVPDPDGGQDQSTHTIEWSENLTGGVLWLWGGSGAGMDFGYDSFDRSWRIGLVVNYGGSRENWLD